MKHKEPVQQNHVQTILGVLVGLTLLGGSALAWHEWHVDGFICFWIGFVGVCGVMHSLGWTLD